MLINFQIIIEFCVFVFPCPCHQRAPYLHSSSSTTATLPPPPSLAILDSSYGGATFSVLIVTSTSTSSWSPVRWRRQWNQQSTELQTIRFIDCDFERCNWGRLRCESGVVLPLLLCRRALNSPNAYNDKTCRHKSALNSILNGGACPTKRRRSGLKWYLTDDWQIDFLIYGLWELKLYIFLLFSPIEEVLRLMSQMQKKFLPRYKSIRCQSDIEIGRKNDDGTEWSCVGWAFLKNTSPYHSPVMRLFAHQFVRNGERKNQYQENQSITSVLQFGTLPSSI